MKEPVARSDLRLALGGAYYGTLRKLLWIKERSSFTRCLLYTSPSPRDTR